LGSFYGRKFSKNAKNESKKKKPLEKMTKVKKESLYSHHQMNDFSYYHRFPEVHSIIIYNASHHFIFQGTPSPSKDKPSRHEDPNSPLWDM
jgi:hypothetical protein